MLKVLVLFYLYHQSLLNRPVIVQIDSKWKMFPFILQASEYFAHVNYEKYWQFLERLSFYNLSIIDPCSKQDYLSALKIAEEISPHSIDTLKLALSVNERLPKCEFLQNVAKDKGISFECENQFSLNGELICGLNKLLNKLENYKVDSSPQILDSWDRIYNISKLNSSSPFVFYYQDIFSAEFQLINKLMIDMSSQGKIQYVFFSISKKMCKNVAKLACYGAALNVKNSDYKTQDDSKINLYSHKIPQLLLNYNKYFQNVSDFIIPNIPESMIDLFFSIVELVSKSKEGKRFEKFYDIIQNIPRYLRHLQELDADINLQNRFNIYKNALSKAKIPDSSNLLINGVSFSENISPFEIIPILERELQTLDILKLLGFTPEESNYILTKSISSKKLTIKLDVRSNNIFWLNNIETDKRYSHMSQNINQLKYYNYGDSVYQIRLNIFNIVLYLDPSSPNFATTFSLLTRIIQSNYPFRFGIVLVTDFKSHTSILFSRALSNLLRKSKFITSIDFVKNVFEASDKLDSDIILNLYKRIDLKDALTIDHDNHPSDEFLKQSNEYFYSLGLSSTPTVVFNGEILDKKSIQNDLVYAIMTIYQKVLGEIRENLSSGSLKISQVTEDSFMSGENFYKKINSDILQIAPDLSSFIVTEKSNCDDLSIGNKNKIYSCLLQKAVFIEEENSLFTIWILLNPDTSYGFDLLEEISKMDNLFNIRFGIVITSNDEGNQFANLADLILEKANDASITVKELKEVIYSFSNSSKIKKSQISIQGRLNHNIFKTYFNVYDSKNYIVCFNKRFGPVSKNIKFTKIDFEIISKMYITSFKPLVGHAISKMIKEKFNLLSFKIKKIDFTDMIRSILVSRISQNNYHISEEIDSFSQFTLKVLPKIENPYIQIDAVLNPISDDSLKFVSFLKVISDSLNVKLRIFLNLDDYIIKPISNRYYRYIFESSVRFYKEDIDETMNTAIFDPLPHNALFTFHADTQQSWFVKSKFSNCDMDNIYLKEREIGCLGTYELEYIIIEGHGYDSKKGQPASGLQLILGSNLKPDLFDTIVIHNLGYFQFKGIPGAFFIKLKEESEKSYMIHTIISLTTGAHDIITIDNFMGQLIKINVIPIDSPIDKKDLKNNWWDSMNNYFSANRKSTKVYEEKIINIFTVATGLLYERFIRIMILSVLEHTKTPVKFWFLKNYLSFQFTISIDILSKKLNFTYEFVQYQWPHFLYKQTDKQRIIWGYKILFLDVLFPLDVKKIIFVDADQIVRADLADLLQIDLGEAPYAYTPFCDDKKEMDKFRFWKSGYWRDHLRGKPYHISALYVVDLLKFRQIMAGDRLRGQYQMLSRDPNSLANLDQDLPNNIQEMVPIKSLPIEWLWCETWCSDKTKEKAKTIDMCNNPLTHEAKLERAKRIAPEWTKYDQMINKFLNEEIFLPNMLKDEL